MAGVRGLRGEPGSAGSACWASSGYRFDNGFNSISLSKYGRE